MKHRMLRNRALCQGTRVAFGFSAQLHEDEVIDIVSTVTEIPPARQLPNTPPPKTVPAGESQANGDKMREAMEQREGKSTKTPQQELEAIVISGH